MRLMGDEVEEERDANSGTPKVLKMTSSRHQSQGKRASSSRKTTHKSTRLTPQPQEGGEGGEGRGGEGAKAGGGKTVLDVNKLKSILKGYGEYPAKYRYADAARFSTLTICI